MKNLKFYFPILFFAVILTISNCKKKEQEPSNPYTGCCETESVIDSVGGVKFYIPNIFSPDETGINDNFRVYFDFDSINKIITAKDIIISNSNSEIIFQKTEIENFSDGINYRIWSPELNSDEEYRGLFSYSLTLISSSGESKTISTEACSFICNELGNNQQVVEAIDFLKCNWGSQHDGEGKIDTKAPSFEHICE